MKAQTLLLALALVVVPLAGCTTPDEPGSTDDPDPNTGGGGDAAGLKAVIAFTPATAITAATPVAFDASGSTGPIASYSWDFGDGKGSTEKSPTHSFTGDGRYAVVLAVSDADGVTTHARKVVKVGTGANLPPVPLFTVDPMWVTPGTPMNVDASATTDPEGDAITYTWSFEPYTVAGGGHDDGHGGHGAAGGAHEVSTTQAPAGADPSGPKSTTPGTLNSGMLKSGESWELTLTEPGIYMMHCHPHPVEMRHNLTIDAAATLGGPGQKVYVTLGDIFIAPENVAVKPGTTVVYMNGGAAEHTSTQLGFRHLGGLGQTAALTPPATEGAYNLILTAQDAKGARAEVKVPVIVSNTLPSNKVEKTESGTIQVVNPAAPPTSTFPLTLRYPTTKLDLTLGYDTTVPVNELSFSFHKGDAGSEALGTGDVATPISLADLVAGAYTIVVTGVSGANIEFTVDILGEYKLEPRPEDIAMYAAPAAGGEDGGHNH